MQTNIVTKADTASKLSVFAILKNAGAFVAWVVGSGFATGQEIYQFFSFFGAWSILSVLFNLFGFLFFGRVLLRNGYRTREEKSFDQFRFYCGKTVGSIYAFLIPVTLFLMMSVLFSGAGATVNEYFGLPSMVGSVLLAVAVFLAYCIGFERMVRVISLISPVIVIFALFVGGATVIREWNSLPNLVSSAVETPPEIWKIVLRAMLYLSMNFLSGGTYYTKLGANARSEKEVTAGAVLGAIAFVVVIGVMNTAILLSGESAMAMAVPTLYMARKIAEPLAAVFSVLLILGIFSASSGMMWTVADRLRTKLHFSPVLLAAGISIGAFFLSLFSFGELLGTLYPIVGCIGFVYMGCVVYRGIKKAPSEKHDGERSSHKK